MVQRSQPDRVNRPRINRPNMTIKIATLNLCLGLQFKKDLIKEFILSESIDNIQSLHFTTSGNQWNYRDKIHHVETKT